ncbi:uncharacterized protein LOC126213481 [Schistocerca nitens]|uniref:uncharacterized protein LOC126213481 n=1 Tax=Schistocerca nitens TaxID=7011 RepID=UPI002118E4D2|nr:uncharacterized protein LOC126213481 [Schistocerca nitens]
MSLLMQECDTLTENDWSPPGGSPATSLVGSGRACARCRAPLGRLVNRGAPCRACRLLVCRACRHYLERSPDWVCSVCHKHMEIQAATGEWMNEYVRRPSRRRDNRVYVPPADVVKRSIRRSWTISNPSSRWSATRDSPELRAYNSLPRHQECCYTSLNHVPRDKSPSYPRDESGPCGSPRSRDSQQSQSQKYSLPDDEDTTDRSPTRSPPVADVEDRPAAAATTSETAEQSPPAGTFRDRMSNSPALSARVRRQQYFSSRSDDDAEFQSRYLQNHVLKHHRADVGRQKSDDYVAGSAPEDKSSSPGSSPSVQESRLAAVRDLRDVTSSSTSHSSREVSPLTRRHQSFDVVDRPQSRTVSLLQHRHSSVDRGGEAAAPASPHRRYFLVGQDAPASAAHSRHSLLGRESVLPPPPHRRPLLTRDYVSSTLEYSGNSDSGGEIVATPPPHGRRYGGARDDTSSLSSHKADGSPVHASSGDDFDVEPISGTVFRKVTVKKRRQETRRVLDNGRFSRRSSSRVVESVRVTEVSSDYCGVGRYHHRHHQHHHHHHHHEPLLLAPPDVDDYKLVFISSDSSSSKEDDDEEEEEDAADEDTESSSSAGCDWDYFEQGCCGERAVEEVTLCDQHCAPPEPAAARAPASPRCAACGSATVLPVPVPIPVPVPFPVPFWSPAHHHHFMQDAALGVSELISPLISAAAGSTVVAVTSTGAVVQCPPAVVDVSGASPQRALAAVPACEIFIRHERAHDELPATVAEIISAPADRPRRDRVSLSEGDSADKARADSTDDAVRTVTRESPPPRRV